MALSSVCIFRIAHRKQLSFLDARNLNTRTLRETASTSFCGVQYLTWNLQHKLNMRKREPFTSQNTMEKETLASHL